MVPNGTSTFYTDTANLFTSSTMWNGNSGDAVASSIVVAKGTVIGMNTDLTYQKWVKT